MQRAKRRAIQAVTNEQFDLDHPFVQWFAAYHQRDAARSVPYKKPGESVISGCDLFMGELAARRFSIGIDEQVPWLGVDEEDLQAIMSFKWSSAAFLRRVQDKDWIALSSKDARIEEGRAEEPIPLRLWLPTRYGLLDGFLDDPKPKELRVVESVRVKGKPEPKTGQAVQSLPLSFKGLWTEKKLLALELEE